MEKAGLILPPKRYANDITLFLNSVYKNAPEERFPVDIKKLALEYSSIKFPSEPIVRIQEEPFEDFDGALIHTANWNILINKKISSGRKNFTLAHEFGHYLLHRHLLTDGIRCNYEAMRDWSVNSTTMEQEANTFASYLLMPFDDFRKQVDNQAVDFNLFKKLTERYGTSLTAVILRWLEQTSKRAVFIVSVDGFIDWAWSSEKALKTKKYFSSRNPACEPIEVPATSMAARKIKDTHGEYINNGGWFTDVSYIEMNIPTRDPSINLTLLILDDYDSVSKLYYN